MYNEEKIAAKVIKEIQDVFDKDGVDYEIVAVNNGSKDKTGEVLEQLHKEDPRITPVHVKVNQGMSFGITSGLKEAKGDNLGFCDGDGQIPPASILQVYNTFKDSNCMLAKATRINREDGWKRILASFGYNGMVGLFFLFRMKDINGKPKIFKREFYESITIESKDWFIDPELIIKLIRKGYKAKEVKMNFKSRKEGKSNVSYFTIAEFARNIINWRIALWKDKKL